ncbi:MAG: ATP-dependent RNA helicase HrpA [Acidimicrobiia bacterium]|nr:ATP-dependent RNA helicase HrpA [Acidimicrobiia bacterium]
MNVNYPPDLPIAERREELLAAIRDHQVVVVAGETGSGKSTQLPKMCLELGLHEVGWIGHTQPRRIAARSIAERVSEELGDELGGLVGYKVRFTDKVSNKTAIKTMTDGILLAEMQHDRRLSKYSVIIIDEAHERSLNIDFLLGYLKQLLPKRPDLKIIVTSATIDTARFSEHFGGAPIIEVSGRTYPVEIRYRPPEDEATGEALSQAEAIVDAVIELENEAEGDILVFCSGERDIREASDALTDAKLRDIEIVPLYGRLSAAEQHRVFERKRSGVRRRIVIATNVAETSLTVPGIRYVVDPGTARISRYSNRTKVQRLPIEDVSQASANQRSGRCGRVAAGIAVRLYSEENFANRSEFTEPEITRTNLASVILQMASLGLGDMERFPFVEPPELRNIRDGVALLEELDAVDPERQGSQKWLTPIGRELARLPIDPRFGRMVIEGAETGCLREVMIITAALSVQDPRERPAEKREEAAQNHARFAAPGSDFLAWLNLWHYIETERRARSGSQFRKMCKREFLNFNRIREWQDIVRQLERTAQSFRWQVNSEPASEDAVHQALLTGLLSQVGLKDASTSEFTGGRNARFLISRGSALGKKPPNWVMAGELVETNRLWAHSAARIQPEWAERAGEHVTKRSYDEAEWDRERGSAMTVERVSLYGVPLVAGRRVHYRRVDEEVARQLFIHHALIEGDWETHHAFFAQNESVLDEVRRLGARQRRDLFVEYDVLFDFYDQRLPPTITSGADFDRWWNKRRKRDPRLLDLRLDDIFEAEETASDESFPEVWRAGDVELEVDYEFDATSANDGVTVLVPVSLLGHLDAAAFEWNVPGLREELVTALLRTMPKAVRKPFVPIPDTVSAIMPNLIESNGNLIESVRQALRELSGNPLPADALVIDRLPTHLRPVFRVVADDGQLIAQGRDLDELRSQLAAEVQDVLAEGEHDLIVEGATSWMFGEIPRAIRTEAAGQLIDAYPSLVDEGSTVALRLLADADLQYESMWSGTRQLLRLNVGGVARMINDRLDRAANLAIAVSPHGSKVGWVNDLGDAIFLRLLQDAGGPVWNEHEWEVLAGRVRDGLPAVVAELVPPAVEILVLGARLRAELTEPAAPAVAPARLDMLQQLERLVYPNHLSGVGADRLADVARYLRGIEVRLEKLPDRVTQDAQRMTKCRALEADYDHYVDRLPSSQALLDLNWELEEFRVASFAQQIGVSGKVSEKRIRASLRAL